MTPGLFSHSAPPGGTRDSGALVPAEPTLPATREAAEAALALWEKRVLDRWAEYALARRRLEQARQELACVQATAAGEFDDAGTYAIGSRGAWRVE